RAHGRMVRAARAVEREPARAGAALHHRGPDFCHRALLLAATRDRLRAVSTSRAGAAGGGARHFHRHVGVLPSLYPHVPYDQAKDFVPVTLPAYAPNVLVASPSLPVKSVEQLAEFVKANPGKLSFASAGMGTTPYLSGELFKLSLGADLVHAPFNGSAPAIQSTLGGHTQFAFVVLAPAVPHIKEGSLRGLAVLSAQRSSALPDV